MKSKSNAPMFGLVLLSYVAFISLGLPDGLLGVAWPSMRSDFARPLDAIGMLLFASTAGYLTSSFLSGRIIAVLGVGGVLAVSCGATGLGLIGYTLAPYWWMMIILGVVVGLGAGAIDAGINTFVASNFKERAMQWLHASWGIGVTIGPVIMTVGLKFSDTWRAGYIVVGAAQIILGICFSMTIKLWQNRTKPAGADGDKHFSEYDTTLSETLKHSRVWLSISLFFVYAGVEATLGTWVYTLLTESRGVKPGIAGFFASSYWATFTAGRILGGIYAGRLGLNTLLRMCIIFAFAGAVLLWWNPGIWMSVSGVAIIGLSIAPIYPAFMSGTGARVGARYTANTIGMQAGAAGIGWALLPSIAGVFARHITLEIIPVYLAVLCVTLFLLHDLSVKVNVKKL